MGLDPDFNIENGKTDVSEYVANAQTPLDSSNITDMDMFVFSTLAYIRGEDVFAADANGFTSPQNNLTVSEYASQILDAYYQNPRDFPGQDYHLEQDMAFLQSLVDSPRYSNCVVSNMAAVNDSSQWAALTITPPGEPNVEMVSFRGTDHSQLGWEEDFFLGYEFEGTEAQWLSQQYMANSDAEMIYAGGHSKGGNDAVASYVMNDASVRDRIVRVCSFDGPGNSEEFVANHASELAELDDKMAGYYPQDCMIGHLIENNPGEVNYIHSDIVFDGIDGLVMEHDPYNWNVTPNGQFVPDEQTNFSKIIDGGLNTIIGGLSLEEQYRICAWLDEFGVPAMVADHVYDENQYTIKDDLPGTICAILELCTDPELKATLAKSLVLAIVWASQNTDVIGAWLDDLTNGAFSKIANKLEDIKNAVCAGLDRYFTALCSLVGVDAQDVYDKISEFADFVKSFVGTVVEGLNNFVSGLVDFVTGKVTITDANFFVNCALLESCAEDMLAITSSITDNLQAIDSAYSTIRSNMNYALFPSIYLAKRSLEDALMTFGKLRTVVAQSAAAYEATENTVKGLF